MSEEPCFGSGVLESEDTERVEIDVVGERNILNNTDYTEFFQERHRIRHYHLSIEQRPHGDYDRALIYSSLEIPNDRGLVSYEELVEYARSRARTGSGRPASGAPSPLDMRVCEQCWLVIELDRRINWHFAPNSRACTSKHRDPENGAGKKGHNVWLRHVYPDGDPLEKTKPDAVGPDGCRVLFFGVTHRGHKDKGTNPHHYFNLKIEFFENSNGRNLVLPVVLDPDVGNDGQQEIP